MKWTNDLKDAMLSLEVHNLNDSISIHKAECVV
jgi:hypothetical protein